MQPFFEFYLFRFSMKQESEFLTGKTDFTMGIESPSSDTERRRFSVFSRGAFGQRGKEWRPEAFGRCVERNGTPAPEKPPDLSVPVK